METIKDEKLLRKIKNVIHNIEFGVFNREIKKEQLNEDLDESYSLLETYNNLDVENKTHKFFVDKLGEFIQETEYLLLEIERLERYEQPFIDELRTKYERLNDGFYRFDVKWFEERLTLLDLAKLTQDMEEDVIKLMEALEYPHFDEFKKGE